MLLMNRGRRKYLGKKRYLPTASWSRRKGLGGFLKSLPRNIVGGIFKVTRLVLTSINRFALWVLTRIPYFRRLQKKGKKSKLFWFNVAATICLTVIIFGSLVMGGVFIAFSKELPSPNRLIDRDVALSTKIYDRNGELLYDIYGDENRVLVTLDQVPEIMREATIAIEDKHFYQHHGFDPLGIVRAVRNIILHGDLQGGSTITQQLVKNALLTQERTIIRKIKEFVLALQIEARFTKDEILQMYLNESAYGGQAVGVEAAAEMYFGKSVSDLTLAEAAMLAGLPAAPSRFSPRRDPEVAKWRQAQVLRRMVEDGYITQEEADAAAAEELYYTPEGAGIKAPHFVMYVRELLAARYGEGMVEHGGLRVTTTLDLGLHNQLQQVVTEQVSSFAPYKVSNGALVALNPKTGEVLSMVGSKDYFDAAIGGEYNVALARRQPGSAIKPITYVTAFKRGYSPSMTLIDIPTSFDAGAGQPEYRPADFSDKYNGIISARYALGSSKNVPAVKMLSLVGIANMVATAQDMGISTFDDPSRIGLSITLGGSEVKLLELVGAFTCFATGGIRHEPVAILKVTDYQGNVLEEWKPSNGVRVLTEQQAYLINDVLSDYNARVYTFGGGNQYGLNIPGHTIAVKTGTTHDNRDGWAIGYTPSHADSAAAIAIGVWIGNNDNSEISAKFFGGAAQIWNRAMKVYLADKPNVAFIRPDGIVDGVVDGLSGMAPGPFTGDFRRADVFIAGTVPMVPDDWHEELEICTPDGKLASDACREVGKTEKRVFIKVKAERPEWQDDVDAWVDQTYPTSGYPEYHPPTETSLLCFASDGTVIDCKKSGPLVDVLWEADGKELDSNDSLPGSFTVKAVVTHQPNSTVASVEIYLKDSDKYQSGKLTTASCGSYCFSYEFKDVPSGDYELRIYVIDTAGGATLKKIPISVGEKVGDEEEAVEGATDKNGGDEKDASD